MHLSFFFIIVNNIVNLSKKLNSHPLKLKKDLNVLSE